jgi:hypothetical protein
LVAFCRRITHAGRRGGDAPRAASAFGRLVALGAVSACLAAVAACRGQAAGGAAGRAAGSPPRVTASPVVRGAGDGLEMWWWVVRDAQGLAGRTLAPYADRSVPIADPDRERLKAGGLRLVTVPVSDLDALQARLPVIGSIQRQWLGELPEWTEVVGGASRAERSPVDLGDGLLHLEPGRLRLLVRCWITPVPDHPAPPDGGGPRAFDWPAAALRLEMVPQHVPASGLPQRADLAAAIRPAPAAEEQGLVLARLAASLLIRRGEAILLVPESPQADWKAPPPERPEGPPHAGDETAPVFSPHPTVGEAMLGTPPDPSTGRRTRAIVVFIPHVPERFGLTPGG